MKGIVDHGCSLRYFSGEHQNVNKSDDGVTRCPGCDHPFSKRCHMHVSYVQRKLRNSRSLFGCGTRTAVERVLQLWGLITRRARDWPSRLRMGSRRPRHGRDPIMRVMVVESGPAGRGRTREPTFKPGGHHSASWGPGAASAGAGAASGPAWGSLMTLLAWSTRTPPWRWFFVEGRAELEDACP